MRKSVKQVLAAAAATLTVSAGIAAPTASAAYVSIENKNSQQLLEVPGWSTVTWQTLGQWYTNRQYLSTGYAGENQQWVIPHAGQTFTIRNRHSQKCIATNGAGLPVAQAPCSSGWEQQWTRTDARHTEFNGEFSSLVYSTFTNPATGLVLDVDQASRGAGAPVISWYPNGGNNQAWHLSAFNLWNTGR